MLAEDSFQSLGGKARAESLSAKEKTDIARKAAKARWSLPKAICGAPDRPLRIGNCEIPCYVLEDETRVLVQSGMIKALGMSHGGTYSKGGDRLAKFTHQGRLKPFMDSEILERTDDPLKFQLYNGSVAYGYDATLLAKICFAVLDAAKEPNLLQKQQTHIVKQAEILVRGFAIVGITALVDEATGYQEVRDRHALRKILERYITDEWAKWTRRFPTEFYRQLFRLKNVPFPPNEGTRKPSYVGHWTNDIVYSRLAPGILKKLKELVPRNPSGSRSRKFHQHLTEDIGVPELQQHISNLIFLMKGCKGWDEFKERLELASPKFGDTMRLPMPI